MNEQYTLDGEVYSYDDIKYLADSEGLSVDDYVYINEYKIKTPKNTAGDEYAEPSKKEKYTEFEPDRNFITVNGQQVFEDEYNVNFAGKPIANSSRKYPTTFEDYAKSFKAESSPKKPA